MVNAFLRRWPDTTDATPLDLRTLLLQHPSRAELALGRSTELGRYGLMLQSSSFSDYGDGSLREGS